MHRFAHLVVSLALAALASTSLAEENTLDEYQASLVLHHALAGKLTGSLEAEYHTDPDRDTRTVVVAWPGLTYTVDRWLQVSGGLRSIATKGSAAADLLELRPYVGARVQVQTPGKWHFYNYSRYEYRRIENRDTDSVTEYGRLRSRFAMEIPFASADRAWKADSWYGLADVEPYFRFDRDAWDPVIFRCGLGYVVNDHVRVEVLYHAQFARPADGGSREVTSNILQLNLKIGAQKGLLRRLQNMTHGR